MRGRLFSVLAVALLAAAVPARAAAAETPWTPVTPAPPVPADFTSVGLFDVTAASPADIWAVGGGWTDVEAPLIVHWTGAGWGEVTPPSAPNLQYMFAAVDAVSANDVWAVGNGEPSPSPGFAPIPVIAHYDGRAWSMVPPPAPPSSSSYTLIGVDMLSATDGWAVGWRQGPLTDPPQPLALRWRNGRWVAVSMPRIAGARLAQVSARSANDVWAVGAVGDDGLLVHFDGTRWTSTIVPHGDAPDSFTGLRSVTAVSADDVWAVGSTCVLPGGDFSLCQPLVMHLSGGVWRVVSSAGDGGTNLQDVVAVAPDDVWVVGYDLVPGGQESNHVEHWDGQRFTTVPASAGGIVTRGQLASALEGVTRPPGTTEVWAVGWQDLSPQMIRHG